MKNKKSCVQKNKQTKKSTRRMGNKVCAPARSVLTPVQTLLDGPLHLPSSWVPLSLSLPLWHSLSFSPPPLAASCQSSWFTPPCLGLSESCERLLFRSVTADWEQLTQGQGERRESESRSAQPVRNHICIPAEREKGKLRHRKEKTAERE